MAIEKELGSTEVRGWYRTNKSEYGSEIRDIVIYDHASWQVYITHTLQDLSERLGDNGFATMCCLLQNERDGKIGKDTLVGLFNELLQL